MEPIMIIFIIFGSTALIIWRWLDTRHKERIAMIEKGFSPSADQIKQLYGFLNGSPRFFATNPLSSLKWGLVAMFVGGGLLLAFWIDRVYMGGDAIYPASMMIAGGMALVIFYFIAEAKRKTEKKEE